MPKLPELGTKDNPCTIENSDEEDRGYKHCQCSTCKQINVCTPENDFYVVETKNGKVLRCNSCFHLHVGNELIRENKEVEGTSLKHN